MPPLSGTEIGTSEDFVSEDAGPANDFRRLLLTARDSARGEPLGNREAIAALLTEMLLRLTFTAPGSATLTRGQAELAVQLVGEPVTAIELILRPAHTDVFRLSLERIATRTGWRIVDVDRGEVLFPAPSRAASSSSNVKHHMRGWRLIAGTALPVIGLASWIFSSRPASQFTASPQKSPMVEAAAEAQAREVLDFIARRGALAPEFRDLKVVHDLLMIGAAEQQFQVSVGNGHYVHPAMLADRNKVPSAMGGMALPGEFALPSRGGYRFAFTGEGEGSTFAIAFQPAYSSFVYLAVPETGESQPYSFALMSQTGRVHWASGRAPTASDPAVTDQEPRNTPGATGKTDADSGGVMGWLRSLVTKEPVRSASPSREEQPAVDDLRKFSAAENTCRATLGGYGSPGVLSEPSTLPGTPAVRAFLDRSFLEHVRAGYQFSFIPGEPGVQSPASPMGEALYRDFVYVAIPVGDPAGRRSFTVFADGTIRFRTDGLAPQGTDPVLD
jgi:hypothetical protein